MTIDYLIIGQGLAGSLLAVNLFKKDKSVCIIDAAHHESASKVAAGIINPITGKRMVLMPDYSKFHSHALSTYQALEELLQKKFFYPVEIIRTFKNADERRLWEERKELPESLAYAKTYNPSGLYAKILKDDYGSLNFQGGYCDVSIFLQSLTDYFKKRKCLINKKFDYRALKINEGDVQYKNITAKYIIFCEGFKASFNPWFKDLPFKHAQGEILEIKLDVDAYEHKIFNFGKWLHIQKNTVARVGSTYAWDTLDCRPTQKGRNEMTRDLDGFLNTKYTITNHTCGIRPVLLDLNPAVGLHKEHKRLGILNGLGSKGYLLAPFFAKHLCDHLVDHTPLEKNVDIARFL